MRDFSAWFNAQRGQHQGPEHWETPAPAAEKSFEDRVAALEDEHDRSRLTYEGHGRWTAVCRACEQRYELCYDVEEFGEDGNYCGGSPRCIP